MKNFEGEREREGKSWKILCLVKKLRAKLPVNDGSSLGKTLIGGAPGYFINKWNRWSVEKQNRLTGKVFSGRMRLLDKGMKVRVEVDGMKRFGLVFSGRRTGAVLEHFGFQVRFGRLFRRWPQWWSISRLMMVMADVQTEDCANTEFQIRFTRRPFRCRFFRTAGIHRHNLWLFFFCLDIQHGKQQQFSLTNRNRQFGRCIYFRNATSGRAGIL